MLGSRFSVLAISVALFASTLVVAAPAQAGTEQCYNGAACVWQHSSYSGKFRGMTQDANNYGGIVWADWQYSNRFIATQVSSVRSQGNSCDVRFYDSTDGLGQSIYFDRVSDGYNYQDPYLANGGGTGTASGQNWDNRIRSHRFVNCP